MAFKVASFGYRADLRDDRDHIYTLTGVSQPQVVDLRDKHPPCWDQGQLGSCTAFGITGLMSFFHGFEGSQLWLYYKERAIEHTIKSDAGAEIRDGIKVLAHLGLPPEEAWPYNISHFTKCPPKKATAAAKADLITQYKRLDGQAAMLDCLANGKPFVFGISVYSSFESSAVAMSGQIPIPHNETLEGGHCMEAVGYDKGRSAFIVRNSWGTDWGMNGYCYLPFAYPGLGDPDTDAWMVEAANL